MVGKSQLLDRFTGVDEILRDIRNLLSERQVEKYEALYLTYPNDGTRATFAVGMTVLDFGAGTIKSPDGSVDKMSTDLRKQNKDFMRSFAINCDQDVIIQLDEKDKCPVRANVWGKMTFQRFTKVSITCAAETTGYIHASTNAETLHEQTGEAIMKGSYAGALKAVAVDADGDMNAVMKGDYGGTLKTWKVDGEGRGEMFVHQIIDYTGVETKSGIATSPESSATAFTETVKRIRVIANDYDMYLRTSSDGTTWEDQIHIEADVEQWFDITCHSFKIQRYSVNDVIYEIEGYR